MGKAPESAECVPTEEVFAGNMTWCYAGDVWGNAPLWLALLKPDDQLSYTHIYILYHIHNTITYIHIHCIYLIISIIFTFYSIFILSTFFAILNSLIIYNQINRAICKFDIFLGYWSVIDWYYLQNPAHTAPNIFYIVDTYPQLLPFLHTLL